MSLSIVEMGKNAKQAAKELAKVNTGLKNNVLHELEKSLLDNAEYILQQNQKDLDNAKKIIYQKHLLID